jgi:uncharacterized membrane protein HdeD (DUF308 family)
MKERLRLDAPLLSSLYKGVPAIILGLVLIFYPDMSEPKLAYIMGMFWLTSGIAFLRTDPTGIMGRSLSKLIDVVAIVTGLIIVVRYSSGKYLGVYTLSNSIAAALLGTVILLTGIFHIVAEWDMKGRATGLRGLHTLLVAFEVVLGIQLLILPLVGHVHIRQTVTIWALVGGILFITTAIYERYLAREEPINEDSEPTINNAEKRSCQALNSKTSNKNA